MRWRSADRLLALLFLAAFGGVKSAKRSGSCTSDRMPATLASAVHKTTLRWCTPGGNWNFKLTKPV